MVQALSESIPKKSRVCKEFLKVRYCFNLTFDNVLVSPDITKENFHFEIWIKLSLFCWTLILEWWVWGPIRQGSCSSNLVKRAVNCISKGVTTPFFDPRRIQLKINSDDDYEIKVLGPSLPKMAPNKLFFKVFIIWGKRCQLRCKEWAPSAL